MITLPSFLQTDYLENLIYYKKNEMLFDFKMTCYMAIPLKVWQWHRRCGNGIEGVARLCGNGIEGVARSIKTLVGTER